MTVHGIEVVCPRCKGALGATQDGSRWECDACGEAYPVVAGIPDLRVAPDPYIGFEADRAKAAGLDKALEGRGFEELIDYYYAHTSVVPPQDAALYKRGLLTKEGGRQAMDHYFHQVARSESAAGEPGGDAAGVANVKSKKRSTE